MEQSMGFRASHFPHCRSHHKLEHSLSVVVHVIFEPRKNHDQNNEYLIKLYLKGDNFSFNKEEQEGKSWLTL